MKYLMRSILFWVWFISNICIIMNDFMSQYSSSVIRKQRVFDSENAKKIVDMFSSEYIPKIVDLHETIIRHISELSSNPDDKYCDEYSEFIEKIVPYQLVCDM